MINKPNLSSNTQLYTLIGNPVVHSLSPFIMNHAFNLAGQDALYLARSVELDRVGDAIRSLHTLGFSGANVTFPLKRNALAYVDKQSAAVRTIGATNLLTFSSNGVEAENTDAVGTVRALETIAGVTVRDRSVAVFGAGGFACAAAYGLLDSGVNNVTFIVRNIVRADLAIQSLSERFPQTTVNCLGLDGDPMPRLEALLSADIIINATPAGMAGDATSHIDKNAPVNGEQIYFDSVYHPRETKFLQTASRLGAKTLDGLALLVAQAQAGFEHWTGESFSLEKMYEAAALHLDERTNDPQKTEK